MSSQHNKPKVRINLSKKIYFFTMGPFLIVMVIMGAITIQNKIDTEKKLLRSRLHNYASLLESGVLSFESITQKDKLEDTLEEHVLIAEIIKQDYTTPYSTDHSASFTSFDRSQIDKAFEEKKSIFFTSKDEGFDFLYPISYRGSIVGLTHITLLNKNISKRITEYLVLVIAINSFGLLGSFILIVFLVNKGILEELSKLMKGSQEIIHGNLDYVIDIKTNNEIGDLGYSFNEMTKKLRESLAARDQLIEQVNQRNIMLRESEQQIRNANLELEARVQQRTSELAIAKEKAEAANRAKSAFLANMSHELRTPLNAVLGFSEVMKNSPDVTPSQIENLNIITRSGEHLLNLINNVLDISKIESGQVELEESHIDLNQFLQEMKSLMDVRASEKGLYFSLEQSPDLPRHVAVDSGKLRQVLINLIGNAVKYTTKGGVVFRAMVADQESSERGQLRIEVEDTGPGIPREDRERIFFPFVQMGESPPAEAGTGLGLAIGKQYVELMGGTIGVNSELGIGSVFYLDIPVVVVQAEATPVEPQRGRIIGLAEGQPSRRLLIVEDQPENRLLLHILLEPFGFDLREALNGQEAVTFFSQWHPHLVFMDIRMPVMDGLEATRRIKATDAGRQTKIVALTAHALEEERREILEAGCDDFIRKPYKDFDVYDALSKHLGIRFVYQEETPAAVNSVQQLTSGDLTELPAELLACLEQALVRLDIGAVDKAIEAIRAHNPSIADALTVDTNGLQYGRVLRLIEASEGDTSREGPAPAEKGAA